MEGYGIDVNQKKWVGEPSPDPHNGSLLPGTTEFEESSYWEKTDISFK